MLRKLILVLGALVCLAIPAKAQIGTINNPAIAILTAQDSGTCSAANGSLIQQLPTNAGTTTVTLAGTFSATVTIRRSNNGGATWVTANTLSATGTTSYSTAGYTHLCADVTAYTSGAVSVAISTGTGGGSGAQAVTTVSGLSSFAAKGNIAVVTDGSTGTDCTVGGGTTLVACLYNGTTWGQLPAASAGATAFSAITGATNAAALVMGTGGSLGTSGTGTIAATSLEAKTWEAPGTIGSTTPNTGAFSTVSLTGQLTSTLATGTAPFSVTSTTPVANLSIGGNAATATTATSATSATNALGLTFGSTSIPMNATAPTANQCLAADATAATIIGTACGSGGGANPGGSGSNLQFRSGAFTFGGVPGSSVDTAGGLNLTPTSDTVAAQLVPTSSGFADPFEVFNQTVVASPAAPTASSVAGGSLGAQTLFAKIAYVDFRGVLTIAGTETTSQAVTASHLLTLAAPSPNAVGAAGYIPFVTASGGGTGTETQQVATGNCTLATGLPASAPAACALSATWTEPTSGPAAGANPPGSNLTRQKAAWFDTSGNLNGLWFSQTLQDQTGSNFARIKLFGSTVAMGAYQWVTSAGANPVSLSGSSTLNAVCVIGGNPTGTDCPSGSPKLGDIFLTPALTTVSGLASSPPTGTLANVSDGTGATDCTTGGGSTLVTCRWSGAAWAAVGGGSGSSSVNVNGSAVSSPNFNGTTPAAGAGNANCTWQVSVSSISCETPNVTTINGAAFTLGAATAPLGTLQDTNGNSTILSSAATTPVNQLTVANAATGAAPSISATGTDTNIGLTLGVKGTGVLNINGAASSNINSNTSGTIAITPASGANFNVNLVAGGSVVLFGGNNATSTPLIAKYQATSPTTDIAKFEDHSAVVFASMGPNGILHDAGTQTVNGADYTNSTVTPSTVFSWTLPATTAAKNYRYSCEGTWESTNTTLVGPVLGLNISAAPTQLTGTGYVKSALNSITSAEAEGYISNTTTGSQTLVTGNAAGVTSTNYYFKIWGTIEGAPTAGSTFIINAASTSGTTATLNIRRGSSCVMTSTN